MRDINYKYMARVYKQKALKENVLNDIKVIAHTLLTDARTYQVTEAKTGEWFDSKYKFRGDLKLHNREDGSCDSHYMFYANSEIGIYCRLIERVLGEQLYYPCIV